MKFALPIVLSLVAAPAILPAQDFTPKPARSEFDMKELRSFISRDLGTPYSYGSLRKAGGETRAIHGIVVDHNGAPIASAQVALCRDIGYDHRSFDENYDVTDAEGRFVVEGDLTRSRVVVRRPDGSTWHQTTAPGQNRIEIRWPKPAAVSVSLDKSVGSLISGTAVVLVSKHYWVGMSPLRRETDIGSESQAVFERVPPGEYAVLVGRQPELAKPSTAPPIPRRLIAVARVRVDPGERKSVTAVSSGNRTISGKFDTSEPLVIEVREQKTAYEHVTQLVDYLTTSPTGHFETRALPPGRYLLRVTRNRPKPDPGELGGFRPQRPVNLVGKYRVTVPVVDQPVTLKLPLEDTVANRVQQVLDSEGQTNVSWSYADVQAAMVEKGSETTKLLVDMLSDPHAPEPWKRLSLQTLNRRLDSETVVSRLVDLLAKTNDQKLRTAIIGGFRSSGHHQDRLVTAIIPLARATDYRMRWAVITTLPTLITDQNRNAVIPVLIQALSDPWDRTRSDAAAWLARLNAESAATELERVRSEDPVGKVRVSAAYAIWKLTGDQKQALQIMTVRLRKDDDYSGQWESAWYLSQFDELPDITIRALVAKTEVEVKAPFDTIDKYEQNRVKRTAISTLNKLAPEALPESLRKKQSLP